MDCTELNLNYGQKISLDLAEKMLDRSKKIIKSEMDLTNSAKTQDAETYIKCLKKNNAFIFDKKIFQSLIENEKTDYIALVLGAHMENTKMRINGENKLFEKGSFTLMIVGYEGECDGEKLVELNLVDEDSIFEYPPSRFIGDIADPLQPIVPEDYIESAIIVKGKLKDKTHKIVD